MACGGAAKLEALAQFREQVGVRAGEHVFRIVRAVIGQAGMQIATSDLAEKDLPFHAEAVAGRGAVAGLEELGDHLQLRRERGTEFGIGDLIGDGGWKRIREVIAGGVGDGVCTPRHSSAPAPATLARVAHDFPAAPCGP